MNSLAIRFPRQVGSLQLSALMLITLLQRTPVLRLLVSADSLWLRSSLGHVLRSSTLVAGALGLVDTLAGATTFTTNPASPASATVGTPFNAAFALTGATGSTGSYTISGLPPGLTVSGASAVGENLVLNSAAGTISGTPTAAGNYLVDITAWQFGNGTGDSIANTYTITVTGGAVATAPSISGHPGNQSVTAGQSASFSVTAGGTAPLSYQWRKNGNAIGGATESTYTIASTVEGDAGNYSVVVTNSAGSATSNDATLTVAAAATAPSISSHPVNQSVTAGQSASFSVSASGTAPLGYQWRKNGNAIGGATESTYTIVSTVEGDAGAYSVVVSNGAGSATSNDATLTVAAAATAPSISSHPVNQSVTAGQSASFSVSASGTAPLGYQWRKNGNAIGGATGSTYTIASTVEGDAGTYSVVVSNGAGSATSNDASLTVTTPPSISSHPGNQSVITGQPASFAVTASGTAPLGYQWRKNGNAIGGATGSTYTIASTVEGDAGTYSVVVSNGAGSATSNDASLTVTTPPSISSHPGNQSVITGQPASFSVSASGTAPLGYQWRKNGNAIGGATGSTYTIASTVEGDAGTYSVVVSNGAGSATSNDASLTVTTPPSISSHPGNQSVITGQPASFAVTANGTAPLTFEWRKNGNAIGGATGSTYTIGSTAEGDAGTYSVVVSNGAGSATSNDATLTVSTPPFITSHPGDQSVIAGQSASFSVTAGGTAPLSYQWQVLSLGDSTWVNVTEGGRFGHSQTANLQITLVTIATDDGDQYRCVVSSPAGLATSNPATLNVRVYGPDFDDNGWRDILWRNPTSGELAVWCMEGTTRLFSLSLGTSSPLWQTAGTGDFNSDGQADILWRNPTSGELAVWIMNGSTRQYSLSLGTSSPLWQTAGTGDFNGDGQVDILWRNPTSGELAVWIMNGSTRQYSLSLGTSSPLWQTAGTGDFNGDGQVDILWRNPTSGELAVWIMNGSTRQYSLSLGTSSPLWKTAGAGDFNGDGQVDILWRNPTSGELAVWIMNGSTRQYSLSLGTSSPLWQVAGDGQPN